MTRKVPPVSKYMTPTPYTVASDDSLIKASDLMKTYKIRHLPVQSGHKIVGLLSLQDVSLLASFSSVDLETTPVAKAMARNPYLVTPDTDLDIVASHMAEQRLGSALIIQENGTLVGIFTDYDALRALAEIVQIKRLSSKSPEHCDS